MAESSHNTTTAVTAGPEGLEGTLEQKPLDQAGFWKALYHSINQKEDLQALGIPVDLQKKIKAQARGSISDNAYSLDLDQRVRMDTFECSPGFYGAKIDVILEGNATDRYYFSKAMELVTATAEAVGFPLNQNNFANFVKYLSKHEKNEGKNGTLTVQYTLSNMQGTGYVLSVMLTTEREMSSREMDGYRKQGIDVNLLFDHHTASITLPVSKSLLIQKNAWPECQARENN